MGNILSAWPKEESTSGRICFSNWLPLLLTFYFLWGFQVVKWLYDFLVEQPWGMVSERKRMIARAQQKREQGFGEWRARLHGADQQMLNKLKRIATLQLTELRDALQREEITAIDALMAYINKALISQDRTNAITEIVKEAYEIAEELDGKWRGKPNKPPLFGVPFSVKSNFHMVGYDCHVGLGKFLEQPMTKECTMVTHLKHLGAVPFCLTNVPQGLLSFVCSNPVYGTTTNPYDQSRSPGGSSGGEGALVADGATPFGTGSDVGGSLRIPAAFCGLVTLKCGQERLVVLHSHGGVPGRGRLGLGFGYFTRTVDEQILLLKDTIGHAHFCSVSPTTPKLPLDLEVIRSTHRLRIGYYEDDGFFKACPAMARAVRETVAKLREQGHEMVKFTVPDPQKMALLVFKNILPDGGVYTRNLYAADVVDKYMTNFVRMLSLPGFVRSLLTLAFKPFSPQASIMCGSTVKDLSDLRKAQEDTDEYKEKFIEYWQELGLDAVVCPSFPAPAVGHEWPSHLGGFAVSTTLYNMLDFPAGVVPVGKATEEDDQKILDDREYPVGYNIALRYMRSAASRCVGLPISVQVVSLPYKEEVCLRVMGEIEKALPYRK